MSRDFFLLKFASVCGILAPLVAFTSILSAIAYYPAFNWLNDALSDLGVVSGVTGFIFNYGLIASGILCVVFAVGMYVFLGKVTAGRVGALAFFLACTALVLIGIFPESYSGTHYFVSVMFFVLLPVSFLVLVGAFWRLNTAAISIFTLAIAVVAIMPWILFFSFHYVSGVAVPETISAVAGSIWAEVLGFKMLKTALNQKK